MYLLGIDVGGTKCAVVLGKYEENLQLLDKITFQTERGFGSTYSKIIKSIEDIAQKNKISFDMISRIGVSCGGPLDSKRGIILSPPNLPGWDNINITEKLEERFGIKTGLQNDANACALAEWSFGAATDTKNAVFLTFGTGMGAGLILNGQLYSGTNDMAGEIGHVRMESFGPVGYGKSGSFEGFCSGGGIAQLARLKLQEEQQQGKLSYLHKYIGNLQELDTRTIAEAAIAGDELAIEIFNISGDYLGRGLAILMDILNPEVIVIGSIFARCRELLWPSAIKSITRESLYQASKVCRVVPAALGENIGDYGALAVALNM